MSLEVGLVPDNPQDENASLINTPIEDMQKTQLSHVQTPDPENL